MEPTICESSVSMTLAVSEAEKKVQKASFRLFFSTYKIPVLSLLLFGSFTMRALNPERFHFGFKRQKTYRFNTNMGYFIGDMSAFTGNSYEETEARIVELFPPKIQKKVKKVIRPVLVLSEKHQLDPFWVLSVMWTESHFTHEVTSPKGARGIMQVMPPTYMEVLAEMKQKGIQLEAEKSEDVLRYQYGQTFYDMGHHQLVSKLRNMEVGIYYLKGMLEAFNHNHHYATVAYNMGPYWTKNQLKNNLPVGKQNHYLNKVLRNYYHITRTLSQNSHVTFIPRI
jgi:hypothetical protein